jgi:hypothetical protein
MWEALPLRRSAQQTGGAYKISVLEVFFNSLKSVTYFMFDKRGLSPDAVGQLKTS